MSCECIENNNSKNIFNFKETDLKYYELVHEDPLCETTCMNEYIVHSNGLVFIKRVHKGNCVDIEIGTINETMAISLIERAESIISDRKTGGINCTDCGVYHIFHGDSEKTTELTIYLRDAPISVMELENDTSNALNDLKPIEQFFVQFIYKKTMAIYIRLPFLS
ncbi:MAG TPA: hypothetical protein EYP86_00045 [Candidatus Altiarchaeales archaeon]|nr:hypothetical protein [Candidatus Altiarchaeales archaeon]